MILRKYRDGDVSAVCPRIDALSQAINDVSFTALIGKTFTIEYDGVPVAVFGCHRLYVDVWQAWMHVSDDVKAHGVFFAKSVKRAFDKTCIKYNAKRINASIDAAFPDNIRFAELIGFKKEFLQIRSGHNAKGNIMLMVYFPGEDKDGKQPECQT